MTATTERPRGNSVGKDVILKQRTYSVLVEALRRRQRFNDLGRSITEQWTGLGSAATEYKSAVNDGYMRVVTPNPRYMTWWRLTEKGARVVSYWLGLGFSYERIEVGARPPQVIPWEIL